MVTIFSKSLRSVLAVSALLLLTAGTAAWADPPGRVARMSYIRGDVGFQPGGSGEWADAVINRPLVTGDRLATDRNARVELEIGAGSIRIDERSTVSLLDINDRITQIELTDGTLNLNVRRLLEGQSYEVDTPTLAFVVTQPGEYRVDVAPNGNSTMVTVFRGSGDVYGENNASYRVRDRQSYRFNDARLRDYEVLDLPRADDFDRFCQERSTRYERAVSSRYVSDEVVGYADLDGYGSWDTVASYGSVWYPRGLRSDWAPYRDGHWAWIDPWGWSWIDDQPWGFAPSHYGRWAYIGSRWGWVPGPRHLRPVYAPALVAFVGGNNWGISIGSNPVGWFPLGPRDVYRPWYDCSRDYFTRVNTRNTIINNVTVVNVYNDYSRGRPSRGDYAYRRDQRAFTAVPGNVFSSAQPVGRSRLRLNDDAIGRGNVVNAVAITPVQASLAARGKGHAHRPDPERFDRAVVARNAPPAQVLPFEQRETIIRENGNRSPGMDKLRGRDRGAVAPEDRRVRVVNADNKVTPREIPVAATRAENERANVNRAERLGIDRTDTAERSDRRANVDAGERLDRRAERARDKADERNEAGSAEQRVPSTRYSPAMRNRPNDDSARKDMAEQRQQAAEKSEARGLQRNKDTQRARADADQKRDENDREKANERAMQAREESARRVGPTATDPPERFRPEAQRQQRDAAAERQADQQQRNDAREQRRAQEQQQQAEAIQLPQQQRSRQIERMQAQEQQRTEQDNRVQAQQMQRDQQAERKQAQEQLRAEQANRGQAQQMQRQQEQEVRQQESQARQMQQQAQMQERQQQAQQMQMQRQQQVQQQAEQQQQQQPPPAQDQRELRKQQKREAREVEEDKQER